MKLPCRFSTSSFFVGIFTATCCLSGCTGHAEKEADLAVHEQESMEAVVDSWLGVSQSEIQNMIGPPTRVEVIDNKTLHTYYFVHGDFALTMDVEGLDPNDYATFQCRFRITYVNDKVESAISDGKDCVLEH